MGEGVDIDEFVEVLRYENRNLESVLEQEPSLDRTILLLSVAIAVDCKDWTDPEEAINVCITSIESVAHHAESTKDLWKEGLFPLTFSDSGSPEGDEWNDAFMEGQGLFRDLLRSHIQQYGEEQIEHAYRETTLCLTYMIAVGCVRSTDRNGTLQYAVSSIRKAYAFINDHCRLVKVSG